MNASRRPLAPWAVFLLTWFGTMVLVCAIIAGLHGGKPGGLAAMERGGQGAGTFGLLLGIVACLRQRRKIDAWSQQQRVQEVREEHARKKAR